MSRSRTEKIRFKGGSGFVLDARLDMPVDISINAPKAYAIFCHCFTCTKETLATHRVSRFLAQQGIAVLRFDFTGLGHSKGDFSETNFTTMINDIIAANNFLSEHHETATILLGHSLGGTAALAASVQLEAINTIITIAAPSKPVHVLHHFGDALKRLEEDTPANITVAGAKYLMKPHFIDDARNHDTKILFKKITKPVLIFSVMSDEIVETYNAKEINEWVSGKSKIVSLATADHLITDVSDARFVTDQIIQWIACIDGDRSAPH